MNKLSGRDVLRAEIYALWATATPRVLLGSSIVMAAISAVANLSAVDDLADDDILALAMHASTVATMIFSVVAGLVSTTAAFRYGSIDQRLLTSPTRTIPFAAKVVGSAFTGLVFGAVGAATAVVVTAAYFSANDVDFDASSPLVVNAVLGILLAAPLYAVGGSAIGFMARSQPLAIGGTLAWLMVVEPPLIIGLPEVGKWLPGATGVALTNSPDPGLLGQVSGGLVLALFVSFLVGLAVSRFSVSDV